MPIKTKSLKPSKKKPGKPATPKYLIYFSIPKLDTPICNSELEELEKLADEFKARNTEFIFLYDSSIDYAFDKFYPWLCTKFKRLAFSFDVCSGFECLFRNITIIKSLNKERVTFIFDNKGKKDNLKYTSIHDNKLGRNPYDLLRLIDGLEHGGNCLTCTESDLNPTTKKKNEPKTRKRSRAKA